MGEKEVAAVMEAWGLRRGQVIWSGGEKDGRRGGILSSDEAAGTSQGGKASSLHASRVKCLISPSRVCVCGLGGFPFRRPLGPKTGHPRITV
jgi:hypothetical protein